MLLFAHFQLCVLKAQVLLLSKRFETAEKLHASKTFLKMTGGRMHTPHPTPLDLALAIGLSYGNHQKSLAYFRELAQFVSLFFTKRQSQKGWGIAKSPPSKYASA